MAHVATRVPPVKPLYTTLVSERQKSSRETCAPTALVPRIAIPPDLEGAYGIITGIIFGLLAWVGLLLPALYFLL
jgi:hypothetical protein